MHNGHTPADHRPSETVVLKLLSVPEKGEIIVRFLGEMQTTMTHFVPGRPKGHSEVCLGERCDAALHKKKRAWKGYAPVEVFREVVEDWYPGVLEITEALGQQLAGRVLTGELWSLQRLKGEFKHPEVVGMFLTFDRPAPVITKGWVDTVCFRLYRTTEILWGQADPLPTRVRIETRKAPPPPRKPAPMPENPRELAAPTKSIKEMLREAGLTNRKV